MFEEYAGWKILRLFFDEPFKKFHLRGVARACGVSAPTAKTQLDKFVKEGLIEKSKKANLLLFEANTKSQRFKLLKVAHSIEAIIKSNLIEELKSKLKPSSITLFGSVARGEDDKGSDLDLLVISKNKQLFDLMKFEKKLGKEINLVIYSRVDWAKKIVKDKPFYQRILIEGIALEGELPVIE